MTKFPRVLASLLPAVAVFFAYTVTAIAAPVELRVNNPIVGDQTIYSGLNFELDVEVSGGIASFTFANNSTGQQFFNPGTDPRATSLHFEQGLFGAGGPLTTLIDPYITGLISNYDGDLGFGGCGFFCALNVAYTVSSDGPGDFATGPLDPVWSGGTYVLEEIVAATSLNPLNFWNLLQLAGDSLTVNFGAAAGTTTESLIALLSGGDTESRVGLAISGCADGVDCTLDTWPVGGLAPIPVPAALPLFLSGLLGLGIMARRRKQQAAAA